MNDPSTLNRLSVRRFQPTTWRAPVPVAGFIWLLLSLSLLGQSTVQFPAATVSVNESNGQAVANVRRANDLDRIVTVDYATSDATATADQDYLTTAGSLTFVAGQTNQTIVVPILNDGRVEGAEALRITLSNPGEGALLGSRISVNLRISDNDTGPYFASAVNLTVEDVGSVLLGVHRGDDGDQPVTVDYVTVDGTALAGTDYEAAQGTLSFQGDEFFKEIPVVILNDGVINPDKSFQLQLSNASSGGVGNPSLATVIIQDPTPVIHTQPTPASQSVSLGVAVKIQVSAKGARMQWQKRVGESEFTDIPGATRQVLEWSHPTAEQTGEYRIIVSSSTGESVTSQVAELIVDPTFIKITGQPLVEDREPSGGYAWFDYDGDGWVDLLVGNWMASGSQVPNSLYRNQGDGTFTKITNELTTAFLGPFGVYPADYDNDGRPDILMGEPLGSSRIFHNQGAGEFTLLEDSFPAIYDGAWHDLDEDGWLDLLTFGPSGAQAFRNSGTGRFQAFAAAVVGDLGTISHTVVGGSFVDFDNDGNSDLYVGADNANARFLRNLGGGRFEQVRLGSLPATMGDSAIWADYDNDGFIDAFTSGWAGVLKLHHNVTSLEGLDQRQFEEVTTQAGFSLPPSGLFPAPNWGDFDNDGDLDIFFPNYRGTNSLFVNRGDGTFVSVDVGSPLRDGERDLPGVWVDYDNDGFLDLFVPAGDGQPVPNFLYRNNLKNTGNENHWLSIRLEGRASNRSGIGSVLRLRATIDGREVLQLRQTAKAGWDTVSQSVAHFGLGDATKVDTLRIEWPSGIVQELKDVAVNQHLEVVESHGVAMPEPPAIEQFDRRSVTVNCPVEGVCCVLEMSLDLVNWSKVKVQTRTEGTVKFSYINNSRERAWFYRVVVP
jgi:hypothetical protein